MNKLTASQMVKALALPLIISLVMVSSVSAVENGGYANEKFIVSTSWLAAHLHDPNIRILDRQDIFPKDNFYAAGHVPNSIRMFTTAIKGTKNEIPEMLLIKDLLEFLDKNGVSSKHHIVLVGRSDREPATTRVFWALEILGHKEISVLDGGIDKWRAEGRPLTKETPKFNPGIYEVTSLHRDLLMTGEELTGYIGLFDRLNLKVVDSRRPDEFRGEAMSRDSQKLGHIPGSINLMFTQVLTGGKEFKELKNAAEIQKVFEAHGLSRDKSLVFTCVSGCFGTTLYYAARLLGYSKVSIYDGGWIEWSQKNYPVETSTGMSPSSPAIKGKPAPSPKEKPAVTTPIPAPKPTPAPGGMKILKDEGC